MEYKDTKLIVFLKTLTNEELISFEKFLSNPYFIQSRDPLPLLKVLKKYFPDFESDELNEDCIFHKLYPVSDYSNKNSQNNFRSLSSYLVKALEEFLFISDIRSNNVLRNRIILEELLDRNLLKYYDQYLHKANTDLKNQDCSSGINDIEKILLGRVNSRYSMMKLDLKAYLQNNFTGLEITSAYFWLNLFRNAKTKYLTETDRGIHTGNTSPEQFLKAVDIEKILEIHKDNSRYVDLLFNYYTYMSLINDKDTLFYERAKELFFKNKSGISRTDRCYYYSDLINLASAKKVISDSKDFCERMYSLTVSCLQDKAYKIAEEDFMQPDFYRNAVLFSCRLKKYEWAENFINEYTCQLMPEYQENMKYYSKAVVFYGTGEFDRSLENILKVKYDLAIFKVDVKIIMLRIFYELEMTEQFYSLADTFKHYIKNSGQFASEDNKAYNNYVNFFVKILKQKSSANRNGAGLIKDQINKEKYLYDKSWLIGKLDEIDICCK